MSHRTKGSPEEKVAIVQRCLSGELSLTEAARIAGVNESSVREWIRLYNQEGSLGLLRTKNNCSYDPELKRKAVEAYLAGGGSIRSICEKFKIRSSSQLGNWIKLYNSGKNC